MLKAEFCYARKLRSPVGMLGEYQRHLRYYTALYCRTFMPFLLPNERGLFPFPRRKVICEALFFCFFFFLFFFLPVKRRRKKLSFLPSLHCFPIFSFSLVLLPTLSPPSPSLLFKRETPLIFFFRLERQERPFFHSSPTNNALSVPLPIKNDPKLSNAPLGFVRFHWQRFKRSGRVFPPSSQPTTHS